jgi:hypothetical protein
MSKHSHHREAKPKGDLWMLPAIGVVAVVVGAPVLCVLVGLQADLPGRLCLYEHARHRAAGGLFVPGDYYTTNDIPPALLLVFAALFLTAFILVRGLLSTLPPNHASRAEFTPRGLKLAGLAALLLVLGWGLFASATNTYARFGSDAIVVRSFLHTHEDVHRWSTVQTIEERRVMRDSSGRGQLRGTRYAGSHYVIYFSDGSEWQSPSSTRWSWSRVGRAVLYASEHTGKPIERRTLAGSEVRNQVNTGIF